MEMSLMVVKYLFSSYRFWSMILCVWVKNKRDGLSSQNKPISHQARAYTTMAGGFERMKRSNRIVSYVELDVNGKVH